MIIDTHCHASTKWYEPLEALLFNLDRYQVDKAVLIPLLGAYDSADMAAAVGKHPDRLAWFAAVDPSAGNVLDTINSACDSGARGLRMRAAWRSKNERPMALWEQAERLGLAISLVGTAASFVDGSLAEVASCCPRLSLVLEHFGGLARPDVGDRAAMLGPICALAAFSNISIKLPGLGQLAPRKAVIDHDDIPLDLTGVSEVIGDVLASFGSGRMMWGSDYPPVAAREGYGHALSWTRALLEPWGVHVQAAVFGGSANALLF